MKDDNTVGSPRGLSTTQTSILLGKILGDGCLEKNGKHVRLKIEHADKQKEYVLWLYNHFLPLNGKIPKRIFYGGGNRKPTWRWMFSTLSLECFDSYFNLFYKDKKKIIPENIFSLLRNPISLAVWYMDDGFLRTDHSGMYLCTSSFALYEQKILIEVLKKNFSVNTSIHFAGKYARLHIPASEKKKFVSIIEKHILPSFKYKLP